jgi:hypothetical protein
MEEKLDLETSGSRYWSSRKTTEAIKNKGIVGGYVHLVNSDDSDPLIIA